MSEFTERAVRNAREIHVPADGASAAIGALKPTNTAPRSLSKKRASNGVNPATHHPKPKQRMPGTSSKKHASNGVSPAITCVKPTARSPGTSSKKRDRKITRAAREELKPKDDAPPTPSKKRSRRAASPANNRAKPIEVLPGTHKAFWDSVAADVATAGNAYVEKRSPKRSRKAASPAKNHTKPISATPGTSSPKRGHQTLEETRDRIVTARRSKHHAKPKRVLSGDNSEGHRRHDTRTANTLEGRANAEKKPRLNTPDLPIRDGQLGSDTHETAAVAGDDHMSGETQSSAVIATIRELWRRRQSWHRAEKSLTLQAKAVCRRYVGGDKKEADKLFATVAGHTTRAEAIEDQPVAVAILPLMMASETVEKHRAAVEKELAKLAKLLPIYPWIEAIPGVAAGSLAALVGECGDIGSYKSAAAVWKRMGLAVIKGGRQRRVSGVDALEHGYSPQRRSVMWNIGGGLIGGMGKGPRPKVGEDIEARADWSPYQKEFVRLLRLEVERVTETWNGPEHKREPAERKGETYESFSAHAAARIKRRIEKQFLAELYGAWREIAKAGKT